MESINGTAVTNGALNGAKVVVSTSEVHQNDARSQRKAFSAYQHTIYMNGTKGVLPPLTTNPNGWEAAAKAVMEPRDLYVTTCCSPFSPLNLFKGSLGLYQLRTWV